VTEDKDPKKSAMRWSIKWKLMAIMAFLMISLIILLSYTQILAEKKILVQFEYYD